MMLTPTQRRITLGFTLSLAIAVTAVSGDNASLPVEPKAAPAVSAVPRAPDTAEKQPLITLEMLNRTPPTPEGKDLFASKSWYVPPPPPVVTKPGPPPKPTAPPLPFTYVGQLEGKDGVLVFLSRSGELLSTKQGEQLDKNYRLESVSAEQLTFVYLPLQERQTLVAGVRQ